MFGLLLAVAYEMVLLGVEQLGKYFASTRIAFIADVHPFQTLSVFLLLSLIAAQLLHLPVKGAPALKKKTRGRFFFQGQFCWTN